MNFSKSLKHLFVSVLFCITYISVGIENNSTPLPELTSTLSSDIDNGWYTARVEYYNSKTYTRATYTLNVYVEYNSISKIDFGDGGSVHDGYNNSGYSFYSSSLRLNKDYNGNVRSATADVTVTYYNPYYTQTFDITIE
tara:strand:- start:546 stop:962 length:417 start_codon:yes stop_codon:yes gene_type:complete